MTEKECNSLESILTTLKGANTIDLLDMFPNMSRDRAGDAMVNLTRFFSAVGCQMGDQMIALALHFGVVCAEADEGHQTVAAKMGLWSPNFEERLLMFCEMARAAYRDRQEAAEALNMDDKANVSAPKQTM